MNKIYMDFEIETELSISVRRPCNNQQEEKNLLSRRFCRYSLKKSQNKRKWKDGQIPEPCQRGVKAVDYEGDNNIDCSWKTFQIAEKIVGDELEIGRIEPV